MQSSGESRREGAVDGGLTDDRRHGLAGEIRSAASRLGEVHPAYWPLRDRALLLQIPGPDAPAERVLSEVESILSRVQA